MLRKAEVASKLNFIEGHKQKKDHPIGWPSESTITKTYCMLGGRITLSITCTTPLLAATSAATTLAPLILTLP